MCAVYGVPPDYFDSWPHHMVTRELIILGELYEDADIPLTKRGMIEVIAILFGGK